MKRLAALLLVSTALSAPAVLVYAEQINVSPPVNANSFIPALGGQPTISMPSYASLRALNPSKLPATAQACTLGYSSSGDGGDGCYNWVANDTATPDQIIIVSSTVSGVSGNWYLQMPAQGVHPEVAGAKCDYNVTANTGTDDTTAFDNLLTAISNDYGLGTILMNRGKACLIASGNLTLPNNVGISGEIGQYFNVANSPSSFPLHPALVFAPPYGLILGGRASFAQNLRIHMQNLQPTTTVEAAFALINSWTSSGSIGVSLTNNQDQRLTNVEILGFNKCIFINNEVRFTVEHIRGDCNNLFEAEDTPDTPAPVIDVQANGYATIATDAIVYGVWSVASIPSGGSSYVQGDTLTVPGGTCSTQPTLTASSVTGGVIGTLTPLDSGDCSAPPYTMGVSAAAIPDNVVTTGTGCTPSTTLNETVSGGTETTAAVVNVTTNAAGQITGVNSITTAGVYTALPNNAATVTGNGCTGAVLMLTWAQNAITLSGGSGSGATAVLNFRSAGWRPGIGFYVHNVAGMVFINAHTETFATGVLENDSQGDIWYGMAAEGDRYDSNSIGYQAQGCTLTEIHGGWLQHQALAMDMDNSICSGFISVFGTHLYASNNFIRTASLQFETGSYGSISGLNLDGMGNPYTTVVKASVGPWKLSGVQGLSGGTGSNPWITIDPTSISNFEVDNLLELPGTPTSMLPVQAMTASGTVYQLPGHTMFRVTAVGTGGNGGAGIACASSTNCSGGSGGGGGEYVDSGWLSWSGYGATKLTVTIGGHATASTVVSNGSASFNLAAQYGGDGYQGVSVSNSGGGAGGALNIGNNGTSSAGGGVGGSGGTGGLIGGYGATPSTFAYGGAGGGGGGGLDSGAGPNGGGSMGGPGGGGAGGGCTSATTYAGGYGGGMATKGTGPGGGASGGGAGVTGYVIGGLPGTGGSGAGSAASSTNGGSGGNGGFPGGGAGGGADNCGGGTGTGGSGGTGGAAEVIVEQQ